MQGYNNRRGNNSNVNNNAYANRPVNQANRFNASARNSSYAGVGPSSFRGGRRKNPRSNKWLWMILLSIAVVVSIYFISSGISSRAREKERLDKIKSYVEPYKNVFPDNVFINDVDISRLTQQQAIDKITGRINEINSSWTLELRYNNWNYFTLKSSMLKTSYNINDVAPYLQEIWNYTHTGDIETDAKRISEIKEQGYRRNTKEGEIKTSVLDNVIGQIAKAIDSEAENAKLVQFRPDEEDPFVISDEKYGLKLDKELMKNEILALAASGKGGIYQIHPEKLVPSVTKQDILNTVVLRGEATTKISKDSTENRNGNIRNSFLKFNGKIMAPGEKFSFNKVVGYRSFENGFFEAFEQSYGDLTIGIGGGVCQASTTLYQAALMADLKILDRSIHSSPVLYTEKGQDATVFLSKTRNIDFKFQNTSNGPIYISAQVIESGRGKKNLVARVRIFGMRHADNAKFTLKSIVDEVLETNDVKLIPDKNKEYVTYKDETKLMKKAEKGYVVSTYLLRSVAGTIVEERLISQDRYAPRPAEYMQGIVQR